MAKLKSCGFLIFRDWPSQPTPLLPDDSRLAGHRQESASATNGSNAETQVQPGVQPAACELAVQPVMTRSFLLMKHPRRWDLPKGHVDPGETNLECALRELKEETGIRAKDIEIDPDFKFKSKYKVTYKRLGNKPVKKKLIIYLAKLIKDVEIQLTEHESFQWVSWKPPHQIQGKTIDPLLAQLAQHWRQ